MHPYLRIRQLRIVGITKNYDVSFRDGLNIIAGEISTGKTAVLGFIDYCLGAKDHPEHLEVQRKARSCLLEIELSGERFTIERALFTARGTATIHECSVKDLAEPHRSFEVAASQVPDRESISSFILRRLGLWEMELKEAPTQKSSDTDRMSFRDLLWFCYLQNRRLDDNLLFEREYPKNLKFPQVFDVIFGVHGDRLATLGRQIKQLTSTRNLLERDLEVLRRFLKEHSVPEPQQLEARQTELSSMLASLTEELRDISVEQRAETDVVSGLRRRHVELTDKVAVLRAQVHDQETLLRRLIPLRGQYSEEIKKLHFLEESQRLLDPLGLVECPMCSSDITHRKQDPHYCLLCGSELEPRESTVNVQSEIRSLQTRLRELNQYISDTEQEIGKLRSEVEAVEREAEGVAQRISHTLRHYVSPAQARRDEIVETIGRIQQELRDVSDSLSFWGSVETRQSELTKITEELLNKQSELERARLETPDRSMIITELSKRFELMLRKFQFPKLSDPLIDTRLVPHVRGLMYQKVSSSGALTLVSLGWYLAMFSLAVDTGASHPGFLMIDSPQKNIGTYKIKGMERPVEVEYRDDAIVGGIYEAFLDVCAPRDSVPPQLIVVDNAPPTWVEEYVRVRYTGVVGHYPYGLIDDEEEA